MKITKDLKTQIYDVANEKEIHLPTHINRITKGRTNSLPELTQLEGKKLLKELI